MTFLHGAVLFGLAALLIPVVVHLLQRRRFEVVDWAAMQFLKLSRRTKRNVFFEHLFLLLMRMGLVAVLVFAAAAPVLDSDFLSRLPGGERLIPSGGGAPRDIVLIIDGSYSMECKTDGPTAHESARARAAEFIDGLHDGDRVAIVQAKQLPQVILAPPSSDRREIRQRLSTLPAPRGGVDWVRSVQEAAKLLEPGGDRRKEIVILTDGQRQGWADPRALEGWQLLGLGSAVDLPRMWVVSVVPDRADDLPNWAVAPVRTNRALATVGREARFQFQVVATGPQGAVQIGVPPKSVDVNVDEQKVGQKVIPRSNEPQVTLEHRHTFTSVGSHLLSLSIPGDALAEDNRRDFAVDVLPAIPVLLVDGDRPAFVGARTSDFLRFAIAPARHPQPSFVVRTLSVPEFASQSLTSPVVSNDPGTAPRVLVLQNVEVLSIAQHRAIEEFVRNGGGVWALFGPRADADSFNGLAFRDGEGWLPARLAGVANIDDPKFATGPLADGLDKTFLEPFKDASPESFLRSTFGSWWRLQERPGHVAARLSTGDPLFVERSLGKGRVLMSAVPLDDTWRTDFLRSHDFVRLCHESLYHLAAARSAEVNLQPRQPILFQPLHGEPPGGVTVRYPDGRRQRIDSNTWPVVVEDTRETGVYRLTTDGGRVQYFVVQPDYDESQLAKLTDDDRKAVAKLFPDGKVNYVNDCNELLKAMSSGRTDPEIGWFLLVLVIGLLAGELLAIRSLVRRHPPALGE